MSIRVRLTLWYVAVLCLGLALFAGAVVWQTGRAAATALDQGLQRRAQDVTADLRFGATIVLRRDAPDESGPQPGEPTLWIRILDPAGRVVARQGPPVAGLPMSVLADTRRGFHALELPGERHLRAFILPVMRQGHRAATIQVLTTTDQADAARRQLLTAMAVAGALVVLLAAAGGLFLADRALRPVDRMTRLAGRIGAGELHRRVGASVRRRTRLGRQRVDELDRLAHTFDAMLDRLEEASAQRRRLTADAAHELCTPIATIASGAEIALRRPRQSEEYRAALRHVLDESRYMGRMVDDLLLLARADSGHVPLQRELVEMDEVCRQVLQAVRPLAAAKDIALTAALPPQATLVRGDEVRLGQVVRNLLDNALRQTPPGGAVTLTLETVATTATGGALADGERSVVLHVRDTGPGIAPVERDRIFERFHRVAGDDPPPDGPRGRVGGSGLGLAICKAIVAAHGGHIRVEADPALSCARGAHFVVEMPPVTDDAPPDLHQIPEEASEGTSTRHTHAS